MTEKEIDTSFDLPYTRLPHPKYNKRGSIPAYEMRYATSEQAIETLTALVQP